MFMSSSFRSYCSGMNRRLDAWFRALSHGQGRVGRSGKQKESQAAWLSTSGNCCSHGAGAKAMKQTLDVTMDFPDAGIMQFGRAGSRAAHPDHGQTQFCASRSFPYEVADGHCMRGVDPGRAARQSLPPLLSMRGPR